MDINGIIRTILTAIRDLPSPFNILVIWLLSLLIAISSFIAILTFLARASKTVDTLAYDVEAALERRKRREQMKRKYRPRVNTRQPRQKRSPFIPPATSQSITQHKSYKRLLDLLHGDTQAAARLIEGQKRKNPGMAQQWYLEKVLWDLERDRGRGYYL